MSQLLSITRREMYGLLTQRWILILLALAFMEGLIGVGVRLNSLRSFDLANAAITMAFLGSLAMMGLSLDAVTKERTSSVLDLMLTRPIGRRRILAGKLLAYLFLVVPVTLVGILLPVGIVTALGIPISYEVFPLGMVLAGTAVYLAFFSVLGVAISLFCRSLQSAFALGGAIWVFVSPLVWQFLVLRGLQRLVSEETLATLNLLNPLGAYPSMISYVGQLGATEVMGGMGAPTPVAYAVVILETALVVLFALAVFDRQEEPGYQG
jgi:ABC-type transport system involved in multi-copper enzyme maturation permease subunit